MLLLPRINWIVLVSFILPQLTYGQKPIPNTPQGFQQQYHPPFESFQRHDDREMQSRLDSFAIPSHWFADTFGPEQGAQLATQYAAEFSDFKKRTAASFAGIDALKAQLKMDPSTPTDIHTRRWTPADQFC